MHSYGIPPTGTSWLFSGLAPQDFVLDRWAGHRMGPQGEEGGLGFSPYNQPAAVKPKGTCAAVSGETKELWLLSHILAPFTLQTQHSHTTVHPGNLLAGCLPVQCVKGQGVH